MGDPRILAPCGTPEAYRRHCRRKEPRDFACRVAWSRYQQELKERKERKDMDLNRFKIGEEIADSTPCTCGPPTHPADYNVDPECLVHGDPKVLAQLEPPESEGYVYLNDTAMWAIYCSRCGRQPLGDLERREPASKWTARFAEHVNCTREQPGGGTED